MNNSWRTLCFVLGTTLCSSASADSHMPASSEPTKKPCLTIPSSAAPRIDNNFNLTASGAALWWKSSQPGREFAQVGADGATHKSVKSIPYKWNVGFKAGIGYELPRDGWDIEACWTRFFNNGSEHLTNSTEILPIDPNLFSSMVLYSSANGHMRTKINFVDLTMGRDFYAGRHFTLNPYAGLRGQWIMQKEKFSFAFANDVAGYAARITSRHAGIGPIAGFGMDWNFGWGLSLTGNIAASLIYGYVNTNGQYYSDSFVTPVAGASNDTNEHGALIPDSDLSLGFKWDFNFSHAVYMALEISWEQHFFLDQWRWHNLVSDTTYYPNSFSGGNTLATQGLTGSLRFAF